MAQQCEAVRKLTQLLAARAYCFPVHGERISVLQTPTQYFQRLQDGMAEAQRRLVVASLYCGSGGGREAEFLQALGHAVGDGSRPMLQTHVLLDALRGTRPSPGPDGAPSSSAAALAPLLGPRARASLFHTPSLRGLLKQVLPPRVNEVIGVQHIKAYVFDDDVIMSGANLSNDYFTKRQDRYMVFSGCPALADWLCSLVEAVGDFSYQLQPGGGLGPCPAGLDPVSQPRRFRAALRQRLLRLAQPAAARSWRKPWQGLRWGPGSARQLRGGLLRRAAGDGTPSTGGGEEAPPADWSQPGNTAGSSLPAAEAGAESPERQSSQPGAPDTWVFPLLQLAPVGVRQEEAATEALLLAAGADVGGRLTLASPYLNPTRACRRALAAAGRARPPAPARQPGTIRQPGIIRGAHVEILTASPAAHGFAGAAGAAGFVPTAYQLLQRTAWRRLHRAWALRTPAAAITNKRLLEYARPGWQFHAKGVWCAPPGQEAPVATVIGSSNFGWRSARRDLECQLALVTANRGLQQRLASELTGLRRHCGDVSAAQLLPLRPRLPARAHLAARLIRSFL